MRNLVKFMLYLYFGPLGIEEIFLLTAYDLTNLTAITCFGGDFEIHTKNPLVWYIKISEKTVFYPIYNMKIGKFAEKWAISQA